MSESKKTEPTKAQLETLLKPHDNTKALTCHYFRRDELRKTSLMLEPPLKDRVALKELTVNREKLSWLL